MNFKLETGDFCAAVEFSKKFKVLLGFDVVRLGSLNQRQLENFFQTQKFEIDKRKMSIIRMDRDRYIDQGEFEFQTGFSVLKSPLQRSESVAFLIYFEKSFPML